MKNFNHSKIEAANPSFIKLISCDLSVLSRHGDGKVKEVN